MKSILPKLFQIFSDRGYDIRTGLNPAHFSDNKYAATTHLIKKNEDVRTGRGIPMQELYFFEILFESFHPQGLLTIGNGFGWSCLAFSLMNPGVRHIVIDACLDEEKGRFGKDLTNDIAQKEGLNLEVVEGFSPADVKRIVEANFDGGVDFVFIDGLHTNDQQYSDFRACAEIASDSSILVFHDVVNHNLMQSFKRIGQEAKFMKSKILYRTATGMGVLYPKNLEKEIEDKINLFFEPYERIKSVQHSSKLAKYEVYMKASSTFYKNFFGLTS